MKGTIRMLNLVQLTRSGLLTSRLGCVVVVIFVKEFSWMDG